MIEKLKNGNTMITLGEGTVLMGNTSAGKDEKPFGIHITDVEQNPDNTVIIALPSNKAIASYMMAMVRFLDAHVDESTSSEMMESIKGLKEQLEPMMPTLVGTTSKEPVQPKARLKPNEREGTFKPGDRVVHMEYGAGTVKENVSNEYAEVYKVDYDNSFSGMDSSEGLLVWEHNKKEEDSR